MWQHRTPSGLVVLHLELELKLLCTEQDVTPQHWCVTPQLWCEIQTDLFGDADA